MDKILHKLSKGKMTQLKAEHIPQLDFDISRLSSKTQNKLAKAYHRGKGLRLKLEPNEIEGTGLLGRKFDKLLKKGGIKKLTYKVGDAMKPALNELMDKGITAMASNPTTMGLVPFASIAKDYVNDPNKYQGVKGKGVRTRLNRVLKKAGVKKLVHRVGRDLKPVAKDFIQQQASRVDNEHLKPFTDVLAQSATNAMDRPGDYGLGFIGKGFARTTGGAISHNYLQMSDPLRPDLFKPVLPQRPMGAVTNKSV
jgi:hypothetical protein